ncbi:MAG: Rpn family recombination-promoting nuclease/putative transposase [Spirochaetales bacterium]|nr:Rpn family recombination-promoting nuclease/putative transposase [Spirochaetales bacterium]
MNELDNKKLAEEWENADLTNNFIFCNVMQNRQMCQELIERLLNIKVGHIEYINQEQVIDNTLDTKSFRLDVYVKGSDKMFDLEMQTSANTDLAKRTRYYQAMMDIDLLAKGAYYSDLKESYIMFICTHDPFKKNLPIYTFRNICSEKKSIKLNDGTYKIFYNAEAYSSAKNENVKDFLNYIHTGKAVSEFTERLETLVNEIKQNKARRADYMTMAMHYMEHERAALMRGREEGSLSAKLETARNFLRMGLSKKQVSEGTGLSLEEINQIK